MKGGKTEVQEYSPKILGIIYKCCIVLCFIAFAYNMMIHFGYGQKSLIYNDFISLCVGFGFLLAGIIIPIIRPHTKPQIVTMCAGFYVIATFNVLFCIGTAPVAYIFWLMVLMATEVLHGPRTLLLGCSYMALLMVAVLFFGAENFDLSDITNIISATILTISTVIFLAWINSANGIRLDAYEQAKSRERMQRDRLLTVINNINDAILNVTPHGVIKLYNAATLSLLDTNSSLSGKRIDSVLNLIDGDDNPIKLSDIVNLRRTVERNDVSHVFEDGQKINLYIACSPVRSSYNKEASTENSGLIIVLRDITKDKSLEEERDEFISVVSHELRTPVTIAEGSLSNILMSIDKGVTDSGVFKKTTESAYEQIIFLAKMVNDLSTLSRAERGVNGEAEVVDIQDMMKGLYDTYRPDAEKKGLRLDLDAKNATGEIKVSRLYVEEMLQNFITNAIKYTAEGSITLGVATTQSKVTFSVSDTGIGISRTDQKRVFDKFYRSEDYRTRESSGTGLGLYVTAKLAKKLNTSIEFESKLNHGSKFSFSLPIYTPKK